MFACSAISAHAHEVHISCQSALLYKMHILHGMHTHICTCRSTFCAFFESMAVPSHVVDEVSSIMDGKLPIHQKLTQVLQILQDHGLSQKQTVAPAAILVHPQNRRNHDQPP